MLKHRFRLLALTLVLVAAPASVGHSFTVAVSHDWDCPYQEQARLAAAGYEAMPVSTEGDPAEGSFFDPGRRAVFAP